MSSYDPEAFARSFIGNQSLKVGKVLEPTLEEISTIAELFASTGKILDERFLQAVTKRPPAETVIMLSIMGRRNGELDNQDGGGKRKRR